MIQVMRNLGSTAFITGFLVVMVMLAIWELAWLIFGASAMLSVLVAWSIIAFLPFAIRIASLCCALSTGGNTLPR
jgi:hypothetical protein